MKRYTFVVGNQVMNVWSTLQRPMMLHALLVPVGFELVSLFVGVEKCNASPSITEVERRAKRITPDGEQELRALFVQWVLDAPQVVWPGMEVRAEVRMPVMWGEGTELES